VQVPAVSARRGFTLLELVVAIAVTGIVAMLAYGTLQAGIDTSERVDRAQTGVSADAIARSLLVDALRHLPEGGGAAMNDLLFTLEDRMDVEGRPADLLSFVSYGVGGAPGSSAGWIVTLGSADDGAWLRAAPLEIEDGGPLELRIAGAGGLDVAVLARTADVEWLDWWDLPGRVPAAVRIHFIDDSGSPIGAPIVVHAALEPVL
jgi:prepilin-type N-terminal cleavage/methylation domain-containing protein